MDLMEMCQATGINQATIWLGGDRLDSLSELHKSSIRFARDVCVSEGIVSVEDMSEIDAADWAEMASPPVVAGIRDVIEAAYWEMVGMVGGALSLPLMFEELQEQGK